MKKPAQFDNSWLGITGETMAVLFDINGNAIGTTLDTPNCIAYAFGINSSVHRATGLLGTKLYDDVSIRIKQSLIDSSYFSKHTKFNK